VRPDVRVGSLQEVYNISSLCVMCISTLILGFLVICILFRSPPAIAGCQAGSEFKMADFRRTDEK
jgi:hypothetical protein